MITERDRENLRRISPLNHAKDIAENLNNEGIRPRRSSEYNSRTITRIFRGQQEDINAEHAIFQYYHGLKSKKEELEKLKNQSDNQNQ